MAVTTSKIKEGANEVWKLSGFAANADASDWIRVPKHTDRNIHVLGTFTGSLSLQVQGSNEADVATPTSGIALNDTTKTTIAVTAASLVQILENTEWIRVIATAGSGGASATAYLKFIRPQ